jgi:hypothetical protein
MGMNFEESSPARIAALKSANPRGCGRMRMQ